MPKTSDTQKGQETEQQLLDKNDCIIRQTSFFVNLKFIFNFEKYTKTRFYTTTKININTSEKNIKINFSTKKYFDPIICFMYVNI